MLVMSFHGVPERTLMLGDPYHCECYKTARLLAQALGLSSHQYMVTFQSRFGKAKWLEPYTQPSIEALAKKGQRHIQVVCPGFTSDCLETLEEIAMEVKEAFMHAGGEQFDYIPCLNESEDWMDALHQISLSHMAHWPMQPTTQQELNERQNLAIAQGAKE
jgi:ferrochelatase